MNTTFWTIVQSSRYVDATFDIDHVYGIDEEIPFYSYWTPSRCMLATTNKAHLADHIGPIPKLPILIYSQSGNHFM